ncbi:dTDP-fucosamine acetyltransferase [Dickeya dianthicola]|uniref:dTDP-fucosamine acetyltransferase n=1 Tax=Dickeya dianthicola TaxID=204039 RepID=A0AAP6S2B0_9GAMM|nr:dTDP-4-amino-4,6-dideoxy-D-galactose acyltransferase [Dickeya dianthicola]ATO35170.1 Lipopolysaccharide biosynthesis protein RffC [Dickeya dianthicola RNS04.9]AYC20970.1 dTDP-fucosamine acetyltransferase [Dickeya dianthicola]MBI0439917.1 dTDP-4-amino-4,6-dideoxy-D-galactose acyltransferase [Dickeya dianthicola]MBI0450642.1 dTDP-4-amino-4,6-dideoxy-D-galactose acyltransferase [Dickeya dianthicola]MBI0455230.1 dTDP-4-amino-4,6-dideoxy-D-galactose acyltransferase [Dickeya dianthicola]
MPVCAEIEPLVWESDFFQRICGRLSFQETAPLLTTADLDRYELCQAKLAASDLATADALSALGFRLAEGEVDFSMPVVPVARAMFAVGVREAETGDIPALRVAAEKSFVLSRFRAPWYRPDDCGRFYARWVEKAVHGSFDDACLVMGGQGLPLQGFVTLRQTSPSTARIGVLSAWPGMTGQGIGQRLMQVARVWCQQRGIRRLMVATQTSNLAALRLYLRSGARVESTAYWFYR